VKDTGIGISKAHQNQIFEEFTQADDKIEKQYGGYGLGLAITKKLVNLLDGHVFVESKPGAGATFIFYLPIDFPDKNSDFRPEVYDFRKNAIKRVLIIDDEEAQRNLTSEILSKTNISTETVSSAQLGLEMLRNETFDFVLTDIQMPEMTGFELLTHMRENMELAHIPVIALTGNTELSKQAVLEKGFYAKLTKPYKPEVLLKLLGEEDHNSMRVNIIASEIENNLRPYQLDDVLLFTQGDQESLNAILESFIMSSKLNLVEFERALHNKQFDDMVLIAHKMLPMLKQLKIESCIDYIEKAEKFDDNSKNEITENFTKFKVILIDVLNKLQFEIKV